MSLTELLPEEFFDIKQPYSTFLRLQFRIDYSKTIEDDSSWREIVFDGRNTFFQSFSLEDNGGFPSINIELVDNTMSQLESVIIKSVVGLNLISSTYQAQQTAGLNPDEQVNNVEDYFSFHISDIISANMRIKFGYNDLGNNTESYQNPNSLDEFRGRAGKNKTIYRTPWLYFKILDTKFNITETGLNASVKGISIVSNILDRAKLWKRNAILRGTPLDILTDLQSYFNSNVDSEGSFEFVFQGPEGHEPMFYEGNEDEDLSPIGVIEIELGGTEQLVPIQNAQGETEYKPIANFKTLKMLLNEICAAVLPRYYKNDGTLLTRDEMNNFDQIEESIARVARYSYYYEKVDPTHHKIVFRYQDPGDSIKEQGVIRNYLWKSSSRSIVKNISIDSNLDFAAINAPIVSFSSSSGSYYLNSTTGTQTSAGTSNHTTEDLIAALPDIDTGLVAGSQDLDIGGVDGPDNLLAQRLSSKITNNIANGLFSGSIDIPGDPFYLFDSIVQPFVYLIRITVLRPDYKVNEEENIENKKSYLSGNYLVKKITHTIDGNGFNTNLEISKFPDADTDRSLFDIEV